ncbi:hypothetical protein ACFVHW_01310 [Streptomyces sp. NPDC127110]|uniref:hypothetical protein n=1 Tax=Streptomyces sp. NPDC127110 TaxID=3345362 RepID=UPI00362E6CD5
MNTEQDRGRIQFIEGLDPSGAFPVQYRFRHARNGNRKLFVVFSNFDPGDYGWSNGVFQHVRANILWVRDRFEGSRSYYLCRGMDFSLADCVHAFIVKVMRALGLTTRDVTLWGSSKGGSAALWFGLRHGFANIVACEPQFAPGTFIRHRFPDIARFMIGERVTDQEVEVLDALLPDTVRSQRGDKSAIYLVTSPQDAHHQQQVRPYLRLFRDYEHFNVLASETARISHTGRQEPTGLPALTGLASVLADGLAPRIGVAYTGFDVKAPSAAGIRSYLESTSLISRDAPVPRAWLADGPLRRGRLHMAGRAPGAAAVSLWRDGAFLASVPVAADGTWEWRPPAPWPPGSHTLRLFSTAPDGRQSRREQIDFTIPEEVRHG